MFVKRYKFHVCLLARPRRRKRLAASPAPTASPLPRRENYATVLFEYRNTAAPPRPFVVAPPRYSASPHTPVPTTSTPRRLASYSEAISGIAPLVASATADGWNIAPA